MAQVIIQGRTVEIPDDIVINKLLESRNQGTGQPGNYPIAPRNEYAIQPTEETISPTELQSQIGNGFVPMDLNSGRQEVKPVVFGLQI